MKVNRPSENCVYECKYSITLTDLVHFFDLFCGRRTWESMKSLNFTFSLPRRRGRTKLLLYLPDAHYIVVLLLRYAHIHGHRRRLPTSHPFRRVSYTLSTIHSSMTDRKRIRHSVQLKKNYEYLWHKSV